ncbi:MAG: dihydroorotase [Acetobacteraceae bacterium]|nr:dihydroorotase [Acetobacteraceae bacterium]
MSRSDRGFVVAGGTVVDPASGVLGPADVLISEGRVRAVGGGLSRDGLPVLDVSGRLVLPGLVDIHVHLREPGEEWKEDIASGTRAAAAGGFVAVAAMANTRPPIDSAAAVSFVLDRARSAGPVRVYPVGAVTKGQKGEELAEMGDMRQAGAVAFSDDGQPIRSAEMMRCALQYAGMLGVPVISHCQDPDLSAGGLMNLGLTSTRLGLRGIPTQAEEVMVYRDLALCALTGSRVHIAHVSAADSVEVLRRARARGVNATAEATPHHLILTDRAVEESRFDAATRVDPPLRSEADRRALAAALQEGVIDCIATDHAPHHRDDKEVEFAYAASGISGLETALPLIYTHLVVPGALELGRAVACLTEGPARVLGLPHGTLAPGASADLVVVDVEREMAVDPMEFYSRGKNTPFAGWRLRGWPVLTLIGGAVAYHRPGWLKLPEWLEPAGGLGLAGRVAAPA